MSSRSNNSGKEKKGSGGGSSAKSTSGDIDESADYEKGKKKTFGETVSTQPSALSLTHSLTLSLTCSHSLVLYADESRSQSCGGSGQV